MTKKQLRQRLKDLALGSGMYWCEDDGYFEFDDSTIICLDRFCSALRASDLNIDMSDAIFKIGLGWCKAFDNLDDLTEYLFAVINKCNRPPSI